MRREGREDAAMQARGHGGGRSEKEVEEEEVGRVGIGGKEI